MVRALVSGPSSLGSSPGWGPVKLKPREKQSLMYQPLSCITPQPGLEPRSLDLEKSALAMRPPHLTVESPIIRNGLANS